jgi:hypothetical protein
MAWLQSHQSLGQHPKLRRLSALLGVSKAQAVGHLHCLWWWCLDYAPSGDLVKYEEIDIALAAEWTGDVADFIDGMERAGFLDRGEHGWIVHDWRDYGGRLLERREADAARKAARRTQTSASRPADVQRTSDGHPADIAPSPSDGVRREDKSREEKSREDKRREESVAVADAPAPTKAVRPAPKPKATLTLLTDDWEPTPALLAWADGQGCPAPFLKNETDKFRDYHIGKKTRYAEWDRAWKNWIRKAVEIGAFNRPATAKNGSSSQSARDLDVLLQIANQAN